MKYRKHIPIGKAPIPYVTCRLCLAQIHWDGMYPSQMQMHWEQEHPEELALTIQQISANIEVKENVDG
jgi:hypothetical protein